MNSIRNSYWKIALGFYAGWIPLFYFTGFKAARLPGRDFSGWMDRRIPFAPQWVWIYFLCYFFPCVPVLVTTDWHALNVLLLSIALTSLSGFAIHLHLPSTFPRPKLGDSCSERVLAYIHKRDFPPGAMKFPSLHVAIAWLIWSCLKHQDLDKSLRTSLLALTVAIVGSTVLTKQHGFWDLVGGTLLAIVTRKFIKTHYFRLISPTDDALLSLKKSATTLLPLYTVLLLIVLAGMLARPKVSA